MLLACLSWKPVSGADRRSADFGGNDEVALLQVDVLASRITQFSDAATKAKTYLFHRPDNATDTAATAGCPVCEPTEVRGALPSKIAEASGLAESAMHPGVFYTVNDSPEELRLFAVTETGEVIGDYSVDGIVPPRELTFGYRRSGDNEAVAVGPCDAGAGAPTASGSCVFVADIGQNCARPLQNCLFYRPNGLASLLRFEEPAVFPGGGANTTLVGKRFWFKYPKSDGPFDAETFVMGPRGEMYVATKHDSGLTGVYRIPALVEDPHDPAVAILVASVAPEAKEWKDKYVVDGAIQFDGTSVTSFALMTYSHVLFWPVPDGDVDAALQREPCRAPHPLGLAGPQPEGLAWKASLSRLGTSGSRGPSSEFVITGEPGRESQAPIFRTRCWAQ